MDVYSYSFEYCTGLYIAAEVVATVCCEWCTA